jgi:ligand-binding sensor domain-containing protein
MNFFRLNSFKKNIILISFLLLYCINNQLFSQQSYIKNLSFIDGLPTQTIYDLHIGKNGILYLGTDIGLIKYDGVSFSKIPMKNNLANAIDGIQESNDGTIWCKNFSNQIFHLQNDTLSVFETFESYLNNDNLIGFQIKGNNIWIATQKTILKIDENRIIKKMIECEDYAEFNYLKNNYTNIYKNDKGEILVSDFKKVIFFNEYGKIINEINVHENGKNEPEYFEIVSSKNSLYVFFKKNFENNIVLPEKSVLKYNDLQKQSYINHIKKSKEKTYLCTNDGLFVLDEKNQKIKFVALKNVRISSIVQDNEKGVWISSPEKGLFYMPNENIYEIEVSKYANICITEGPENSFFIGTSHGKIHHYDNNFELINKYDSKKNIEISFVYFNSETNKIYCNHGIFTLGNSEIEYQTYLGKILYPDENNNFLLGTPSLGGFVNQDFKNKPNIPYYNKYKSENYSEKNIPITILRNERCRSLIYSEKSKLSYFGFASGLYIYNENGEEKEIKLNEKESIIAQKIILDKKDNNIVWVSTMQNGVFKIKNDKISTHLTSKNGLSSSITKSIFDFKNSIIVITDLGIDLIDKKSLKIKTLNNNFYIRGININDVAVIDNKLFLVNNESVIIHSKNFTKNDIKLKFNKLETIINDKKHEEDKLVLDANQNNIQFVFGTISFKSMGAYEYHFRLLGFDDKWTKQSALSNSSNYLSLPSGEYTFELKLVLNNEVYDEKKVHFVIQKSFWETPWFLVIILVLIVNIIFITNRTTKYFVNKRQIIKQQILNSQLTALRAQMNPHFLFNILSSVQGLIYSNKKNEASEYLGKFSKLMRENLENSDKQSIYLDDEIEMLKNYLELEALRFNEGEFCYEINYQDKISSREIEIPSMIVQPFVENAIKHGLLHKLGLKKLKINVNYINKNNEIAIEIEDNGIGREASGIINKKRLNHKSFSSKAIESRIDLINKIRKKQIKLIIEDLKNEKNESLGTKITINIPLENGE